MLSEKIVTLKNITKFYHKTGSFLQSSRQKVLDNVSFDIRNNESVSLIGVSGGGKTTLANILLGLSIPDKGSIYLEGKSVELWKKANPHGLSIVFQNYVSSVNPKYTIKRILYEPFLLAGQKKYIDKEITSLLHILHLPLPILNAYPHTLSGGELQRICFARAISLKPKILILDEPFSSLDLITMMDLVKFINSVKKKYAMSVFFITHDLRVAELLTDRLIFLHNGSIIDQCPSGKTGILTHTQSIQLVQKS